MQIFEIDMVVTEVTMQRAYVHADTLEDAIEKVETYEVDNSKFEVMDTLRWEVSDVKGSAF